MATQTLFERLGGSTGIKAIVDDIVTAHLENPTVAPRFGPYLDTAEKQATTKGHLCAFLEAGSGGSAVYSGRAMVDAHRGMNINSEEYMAVIDDILKTLEAHRIDEQTRKDVLAIAYSLKEQIMHV